MNKFEKLIELVNEGEEAKAEELFHDIVVDTSRGIYESLMNSEDEMGGDQADELMNDIAADEQGMREDDDELEMEPEIGADDEMGGDEMGDMEMGGEEDADLEDRVVDLEDQLDALMAEFDSVMGDEEGMGDEMGMDADADMGMDDEMGGEEELAPMESDENAEEAVTEEDDAALEEAVSLTKVTKGIAGTTEGESVGAGNEATNVNTKTINNDNSGAKGSAAKPHQKTGEDNGRANPEVKPGDGTTEPNESKVKEPKKKGEDAGVNKKSISGS